MQIVKESELDLELAEQERRYRAATGDKPWLTGFEARFTEWLEKQADEN